MGELRAAARFWEPRRIGYNLVLFAVTACWAIRSWPLLRPVLTLSAVPHALVFLAIFNAMYCVAYLIDLPLQDASRIGAIRRVLWMLGTIFAAVVWSYWLNDEIGADLTPR